MKLVIQWHITEKCNWRCVHCYQDGYQNYGPSLKKLKVVFDQIFGLKTTLFGNITKKRINFVGGEPFIRGDFIELLEYINGKVDETIDIGILTNGSLITDDILMRLKTFEKLNINFQISLEGTKIINDKIRGIGSFEKIRKAIILVKNYDFKIHLSFTLLKTNLQEVFNLVPFLEKYSINLKVRRFVPTGIGKKIKDLILTSKQWYEFSIKVFKINQLLKFGFIDLSGCSEITSYKYKGNGCALNDHRLITILDNLDVYPCRRFEMKLGNLNKKSLYEIYFSKKYIDIVSSYKKIEECKNCKLLNICRGGAKCITKAFYNDDYLKADPQCYRALLLNTIQGFGD